MNLYVASSIHNVPSTQALIAMLKRLGHQVTYDWTVHGDLKKAPKDVQRATAKKEVDGVAAADVVILLWPGRFGAHTELGAALALNKPVLLLVFPDSDFDDVFCIFHYHPSVSVRFVSALDDVWLARELDAASAAR